MKILVAVTHLLGSGHLARALVLARAFAARGHAVCLASGGMPVPRLDTAGVELLQLPPLRSDGVDFARLLDAEGREAGDRLLRARIEALTAQVARQAPDVIITELYPFGRRILRAEFTALLDAADALPRRPLVCASIRDILAPPSKPARAAETEAVVLGRYDAALVHADPAVTPLEISWPVTPALATRLHYTGFVAPPAPALHPERAGEGEIIVSAGGGPVGDTLFKAALAAAALDDARRWRLLVGGDPARAAVLAGHAPANAVVEPARADFRQMLHHAAVSVSFCGYNTALDLLQTGCRALLVPFDEGREVEQGLRADALARLPGIAVLRSADATPARLLTAVSKLIETPERAPMTEGFDGAVRSAQIVERLAEARA